MGGMEMTGLRMIPSGMGLMMPAQTPWRAMEFTFVLVMWTVMMVGMMTPSAAPMFLMYARVGRQTGGAGEIVKCNRLVRYRLFPGLARLRVVRYFGAMGARAHCPARFHHGKHGQRSRRVYCRRPLSMDPTE